MPNLIEAVTSVVKSFTDNEPKAPVHVGEVMNLWTYLTVLHEMIAYEDSALNTTSDDDVKRMLQDAIKLCESQVNRLKKFMQNEGIPLPDVSQAKPRSGPNAIPMGIKLTDDEIANGVSVKFATANIMCATGESEALRNDIGILWTDLQTEMLLFGTTLKAMMIKRGWIKVPPLYIPPGLPKQ